MDREHQRARRGQAATIPSNPAAAANCRCQRGSILRVGHDHALASVVAARSGRISSTTVAGLMRLASQPAVVLTDELRDRLWRRWSTRPGPAPRSGCRSSRSASPHRSKRRVCRQCICAEDGGGSMGRCVDARPARGVRSTTVSAPGGRDWLGPTCATWRPGSSGCGTWGSSSSHVGTRSVSTGVHASVLVGTSCCEPTGSCRKLRPPCVHVAVRHQRRQGAAQARSQSL
jgi:hypothetical protein